MKNIGIKKRQRILVTAKACPSFSKKYKEVICTAGITDEGKWIRIYPVPFNRLKSSEKFRKYQWIEVDVVKYFSDPRPESYKICSMIKVRKVCDLDSRKAILYNKPKRNLAEIIDKARNVKCFNSLTMFKPKQILDFKIEENLNAITRAKYPYKFYYKLIDKFGKKSEMQIIDGEIHEFCRKLISKHGKKKKLIYTELRKKYLDDLSKRQDFSLFLGTNKYWHIRRGSNPFMIIGIYY